MGNLTMEKKLVAWSGAFMASLMLAQPLLDVVSYFMAGVGHTGLTTALRCLLLVVVGAYGFAISEHKPVYMGVYGVLAAFWLLHALNCLRQGYADPVGDLAEYLKLIQFPLWTLSFVTFFRRREELQGNGPVFLAVNFGIIVAVILLSYATGTPVYTYFTPERGVQLGMLGWFAVPAAQSAIVCLVVIGLLLWAYRTEKLRVFCLCCVLGFALLYFTGTKLAFYAALLVAAGFVVLILLSRQHYRFCIPLVLAAAAMLLFRGASPMAQRQALTADSYAIYEEKAQEIMGEDMGYVYHPGEEIPPEVEAKIRRVYTEVYGAPKGVYGGVLLGDLLEKFGPDRVMDFYGYTVKSTELYNVRTKRQAALGLVWEEKDFLTRLLGFEYSESWINGRPYDLENDFPALPFYYGYLGTALYVAFAGYFLFLVLRGLVREFSTLPEFLTVELGAWCLIFCLGLGAAQFSGNVLRRPSVTVYLSLAAAQIYCLLRPERRQRRFEKYRQKPAITIKLP